MAFAGSSLVQVQRRLSVGETDVTGCLTEVSLSLCTFIFTHTHTQTHLYNVHHGAVRGVHSQQVVRLGLKFNHVPNHAEFTPGNHTVLTL